MTKPCKSCGRLIDRSDDDIQVCLYCGTRAWIELQDSLRLTSDEMTKQDMDNSLARMALQIYAIRQSLKRKKAK